MYLVYYLPSSPEGLFYSLLSTSRLILDTQWTFNEYLSKEMHELQFNNHFEKVKDAM